MQVSLTSELEQFVEENLKAGRYTSAEDMVRAGLAALLQQESFGDFAQGELDGLLAVGEASLAQGGPVRVDLVFSRLRGRANERAE